MMRIDGRKSPTGKAMYWAAIGLMLSTILSSGHGRLQHFVTGAAAAIFIVGLVGMVRIRKCCVR